MKHIVKGLVKNQKFFQDYLSAVTLDDTVIDDLALKMQPQFARCALSFETPLYIHSFSSSVWL